MYRGRAEGPGGDQSTQGLVGHGEMFRLTVSAGGALENVIAREGHGSVLIFIK